MRKYLVLCTAIFLALMGVLFYVEFGLASSERERRGETPTAIKTDDAARAEAEIRRILERYYEIAEADDRDALKRFSQEISAPEYLYSSELGVMDKQAATRHFDTLDTRFERAAFADLTVQVHGDGTAAVAKYLDISTVKTNGVTLKKPVQFTNVWIKRDGAWKIVAEHSSVAAPRELLPRNRFADNLARK